MIRTDLLQVDTYRTEEEPKAKSNQVSSHSEKRSLHQNKLWRSALEVIVEHEVQEFVKDELFQRLIRDKWKRFARRMYLKRTVVPYLTVLGCLLSVGYLRGSEINLAWPYMPADNATAVMCLRNATMSSPQALREWILAELPPSGGGGVVASIATLVMNLLLVVVCAPFLVWKGLRQRRFRMQDLDTNADAHISSEEVVLFVQKNLHFTFDVAGAVFIFCAAGARLACHDSAELNLLAISIIVLCLNLINVLLPFRFFGELVIMMYKILREDVGRFLSIYLIILTGFSWGLFLFFQRSANWQGCELDARGCSDEQHVYSGVWPAMLWLVWVSLGDSVGDVQVAIPCPKN